MSLQPAALTERVVHARRENRKPRAFGAKRLEIHSADGAVLVQASATSAAEPLVYFPLRLSRFIREQIKTHTFFIDEEGWLCTSVRE